MIEIDIVGFDENTNNNLSTNIINSINDGVRDIDRLVGDSLIRVLTDKPTKLFKDKYRKVTKHNVEGELCVICLENMKCNEYYRTLKCNHKYHKRCIDKWINKYNNYYCPTCKENAFIEIHRDIYTQDHPELNTQPFESYEAS